MMTKKSKNNVSIVAANYNNKHFLDDFFQGIINSAIKPSELIIVDDCSTDKSIDTIDLYATLHPWIKPIYLSNNMGVANARNIGNRHASGDFIMQIDPDDIITPDRITRQLNFFKKNPHIDILGGNCWYIKGVNKTQILQSNFPTSHDEIEKYFKKGLNGVYNPTTMIRKKWFENFQYRQEMVWAEDYDLFARMLHAGAIFAGQKEPHTLVRIHGESATSNLKFDTLKKAHSVSRELFGNKSTLFSVWINYLHLRSYRKYLLADNLLQKCLYLSTALLFRPDKIFKRLKFLFFAKP